MTVSRVLNQTGYVSSETRDRVLSAAKEMNYRRNGLARSLKRQRTDTIGLVLGDISNPYSTELARAVRQAATRPLRSARFQSGTRTWLRMIRKASSLSVPAL